MIKHWKKKAHRDGRLVTLYTSTTEKMIEEDLALGYSGSLVFEGRQANSRRVPTPHANHHDFATAAFARAMQHGLTLLDHPPMAVEKLPEDLRPLHPNHAPRPTVPLLYECHGESPM